MPGLFGWCGAPQADSQDRALGLMAASLRAPFDGPDDLRRWRPGLAVGVVQGSVGFETTWHDIDDTWALALYGEFYRMDGAECPTHGQVAEAMVRAVESGHLNEVLRGIDGEYCAVLHDRRTGTVRVVGDRYGNRPVYWMLDGDTFAWSTGARALLHVPDTRLTVSREAAHQMFDVGYLLGDRTWFDEVRVLNTGTVLIFSPHEGRVAAERYRWWDDIELDRRITFEDAANVLGELLCDAVHLRAKLPGDVGLTLSGGLDSRLVLGAMSETSDWTNTSVTFGARGSLDAQTAARASAVVGVTNVFLEMDESRWLERRADGVWWTDGQLDMRHMHALQFTDEIRNLFDVSMSGHIGDLVAGGSYLKSTEALDRPVSLDYAARLMGCNRSFLSDVPEYATLPKSDYFFLENRVRRFTLHGLFAGATGVLHRKPFCDNRLTEFLYSLPDDYRYQSRVYKAALLRLFPRLFKDIEWQKTGLPISCTARQERHALLRSRIQRRMRRLGSRLSARPLRDPNCFTRYAEWILTEPAKTAIADKLENGSAYRSVLPEVDAAKLLQEHQRGIDRTDAILRLLTIETWLQQIGHR